MQGRRFDSAGSPIGDEFQVNSFTTGDQRRAEVATYSDGRFVVVWHSDGSYGTDNSGLSIQGQRFNSTGVPLGEFQVNSYTLSNQVYPSVAMQPNDGFVVTWASVGSSGTDTGLSVQGQRFSSEAIPIGGEFQVNSYTTDGQRRPQVASHFNGDFVVSWDSAASPGSDSDLSILARLFASDGTPARDDFQVNSYTTGLQFSYTIASDPRGGFVIVWGGEGSYGSDTMNSIQSQRFTIAGEKVGNEIQVNSYTTSSQFSPSLAIGSDGRLLVAWSSFGSFGDDSSSASIQGQCFDIPIFVDGFESDSGSSAPRLLRSSSRRGAFQEVGRLCLAPLAGPRVSRGPPDPGPA